MYVCHIKVEPVARICSVKKTSLKNFTKLTEKKFTMEFCLNEASGLCQKPHCKRTLSQTFFMNFAKISRAVRTPDNRWQKYVIR